MFVPEILENTKKEGKKIKKYILLWQEHFNEIYVCNNSLNVQGTMYQQVFYFSITAL